MSLPSQIFEKLQALGVRVDDVEERFIRGSGAGGQKINKTSSTVWLRHGPTGTEVRCQQERSQTANRAQAWEELVAKLADRQRRIADAVVSDREAERRRTRQRSKRQKQKMVATKRRRAHGKAARGRVSGED